MTHAATLGLLVDGLVTSLTGLTSQDKSFVHLRDKAGRALKDQSNARTNQFAVNASYAGLIEKFQIVNREVLADALQSRLAELPAEGTKFMPEILSLLLLLSHQPANKNEIEFVKKLSRPDIDALTWKSIFADDSLDDDGLWDDVERGYHSSGDDVTNYDDNDADFTTSTQGTSIEDEDLTSLARLHVVSIDRSLLADVHPARSRSYANDDNPILVSELVLSREILAMLHGLPTRLFSKNSNTGSIAISKSLILSTASMSTLSAVLSQFIELGTKIDSIRTWSQTVERVDWIQSIQASAQRLLLRFSNSLTQMEGMYISPTVAGVASLLRLWTAVEQSAHPLSHLSTILADLIADSAVKVTPASFALLDRLYEGVCLQQAAGDSESFGVLSYIFATAVSTYLKPISKWLRQGLLPSSNCEGFLVNDLQENCDLADVWYKRYRLRSDIDGELAVPSFMKPFVEQIFATGKNKAFMRLLSQGDDGADGDVVEKDHLSLAAESLDSDPQQSIEMFLPYHDFLADQLGSWLSKIAGNSTPALPQSLWSGHGLRDVMNALEYVYFAKDGSLFESFASSVSARITDSYQPMVAGKVARKSWKDNFIMSELAHNTLGMSAFVDAQNMTIRCLEPEYNRSATATVSVTQALSTVKVEYHFSWPIQNITREHSPSVHGRALAFLLQIQYAKSRLSAQLLDLRPLNKDNRSHSTLPMLVLRLRRRLLWFLDVINNHVTSSSSVQHKAMSAQMAISDGIDSMAFTWAEYTRHLEISLLIADKLAPVRNAVIKIIELCEQFADLWNQLVTTHEFHRTGITMDRVVSQQNMRTIETLQEQFHSSFYFVVAGLRSIGRAGGDSALEMLAQRLDERHG
nr:isoform 2 of gamma-tubulin complex component 5 [Quercus suber]